LTWYVDTRFPLGTYISPCWERASDRSRYGATDMENSSTKHLQSGPEKPRKVKGMFLFFNLNNLERHNLLMCLEETKHEFLIAYDSVDDAIKWKVDGGTWSPPMGEGQHDR